MNASPPKKAAQSNKPEHASAESSSTSATSIHIKIYNAANLQPLYPEHVELEFRGACGPKKTKLQKSADEAHMLSLDEIGCGQQGTNPKGTTPANNFVQMRLAKPFEIGCQSYTSQWIGFNAEVGCTVPFPVSQLEESCAIHFRAYDSNFVDFVENAEAFLDGIQLKATAVPTPVHAHHSAAKFQPGTFTGTTVQGCLELSGLPRHQLYQLEAYTPAGYITKSSVPPFLYICCDHKVALEATFQPCCLTPARSVVFVDKECPGTRLDGFNFQAGGDTQETDDNGIWNVPHDITGTIHLQEPGKAFFPAQIDFSNKENLVLIVAVADQMLPQPRPVKTRFVDHEERPFSNRIIFIQHLGQEMALRTDELGYFEAPEGSSAYAKDDEHGAATEPVLILSR